MSIRKDDIVEVITGDDAGTSKGRTTARVLRGYWKEPALTCGRKAICC